jgi:hypothetical protein
MSAKQPESATSSRQLEWALSRWDNEGGAGPAGPQGASVSEEARSEIPELTNVEIVQLRVRVIALENLVIALLAAGSKRQRGLAREMAAYISPRPGFTHHPLTTHAAAGMIDLVERAGHFCGGKPA